MVADALSRKPKESLASSLTGDPHLLKELERLHINFILPTQITHLAALQITSTLVEKIKTTQAGDPELSKLKQRVQARTVPDFSLSDGVLRFKNRLCVANCPDLKRELLQASHASTFSTHPGSTKMYKDLKTHYWWLGMKKDIADYVAQCLTCQQVKAEHQKPGGLLQTLPIPVWKLSLIHI